MEIGSAKETLDFLLGSPVGTLALALRVRFGSGSGTGAGVGGLGLDSSEMLCFLPGIGIGTGLASNKLSIVSLRN